MRYSEGTLTLLLPWRTAEGEDQVSCVRIKIGPEGLDNRTVRHTIRRFYKQLGRSVKNEFLDKFPRVHRTIEQLRELESKLTVDNFVKYIEATEHLYAPDPGSSASGETTPVGETGDEVRPVSSEVNPG